MNWAEKNAILFRDFAYACATNDWIEISDIVDKLDKRGLQNFLDTANSMRLIAERTANMKKIKLDPPFETKFYEVFDRKKK